MWFLNYGVWTSGGTWTFLFCTRGDILQVYYFDAGRTRGIWTDKYFHRWFVVF